MSKKKGRLSGKNLEKVKTKLRELFSGADKSPDKFRELVESDKFLKSIGQTWEDCDKKARRMKLYGKARELSSRFWQTRLKKEFPEFRKKLDSLLADKTTRIQDILFMEEVKKLGVNTENQLRNYARTEGISIKKGKVKPESVRVYEKRLSELIQDGSFAKLGLSGLAETLKKEFPDKAKSITMKSLFGQIEKLIWTESKLKDLRDAVKHGVVETFTESNLHIPTKLIQKKIRWLRGVVSVDQYVAQTTLVKGIGRLSVEGTTRKDELFTFPDSTLDKPFPVEVKNKDNWNCFVVNGANFGTLYNPLIDQNPLRLALAYAEKSGIDALFITNLLNLEFRKAVGSELHILKAFVSGHNVNPHLLAPVYRADAERILKESPDDEVVYETAAELVVNIISGLRKVSHKPVKNDDEKSPRVPEYNGKVYIVFGYNEESLIANVAYWELNFITNMRKRIFQTQRHLIALAIKQAEKSLEIMRSGAVLKDAPSDAKVQLVTDRENKLMTNLQQLKEKDKQIEDALNRIRVTLTSGQDRQRFTKRLRSIVVKKIEEAIPNSKVIGQASVNVKMGEKIIQLNIPSNTRVTEGHLDSYVKIYGALSRRQSVPDTVIICHPLSLNYRMAVREINNQNARAEAKIYTAPILIDGEFLRAELKDAVRSVHPLAKVVYHTNFAPGILQVSYVNGIVNAERVGLDVLMNYGVMSKRSKKNGVVERIWIMVETDPHFGSRNRVEAWSKATRGSFGVSDAVMQMMRDSGLCQNGKLPVHITTTNDDGVQANHFETHKQPHPRQISYQDKERMIREMKPEEAVKFLLDQDRIRGVDWLQDQIKQVKERHIRPNVDFYGSVLKRVHKSGLVIKPISQIHNVPFDSRDLGAVNKGTGNHIESEINRSLTEGFIYRDYLRGLLYGRLNGLSDEFIDKMVVAPLEGNQYFAWGYVGMPGEYEWAIEFRSDPPRLSSWADVLKATVTNDALRGDYGLYMTGHKTIKIYGDKHFFAAVDIEDVFYHMCASGTSTDLYGHRGFPPNNTGISFVGLPVGGPSAGPILVRPIHVQHILRYFEKPFDFDWASFLPNPV